MEYADTVPTISGSDVIMAYGDHQVEFEEEPRRCSWCTCFCFSRYTLFVINFLVWAAGVTMVGLGAWAIVNSSGLDLFEALLKEPSWLMIATGIVMIIVGVVGCAGALRLNIICLRVFMVFVIVVFVLQLVLAGVVFFMMDDIQGNMLYIVKVAVTKYERDQNIARDASIDYLQQQFQCCGGSSYSDWDANRYYNCSNVLTSSRCGVPSSCCIDNRMEDCGFQIRGSSVEDIKAYIYTEGCIVTLMKIFRNNVTIVAALAFSVCGIEILCLILANITSRYIIVHRKQFS
ncbi:tetraspanin-5-like [Physella acuta]|uniref:tetraspanin-5-like n=1 Tax=Physella acuta TaxID=109671 RepID=UPI0027DB3EE4|nr:tetraspanin-5-like [Physella acuta]